MVFFDSVTTTRSMKDIQTKMFIAKYEHRNHILVIYRTNTSSFKQRKQTRRNKKILAPNSKSLQRANSSTKQRKK